MTEIKIRTQGFKELQDCFRQLPDDIAKQVLDAGVMAGGRVIAKAAKAAAPRDRIPPNSPGSEKYGRLRDNIKVRKMKTRSKTYRAVVVNRGQSFWGDILNRGTRYMPATRWYDRALASVIDRALDTQKRYMVAKITQLSLKAIQRAGANKR